MTLSVVIPTRNRAPALQQALASLTRQTLSEKQFEVIVVDNGSTDNTAQVCDSLKEVIGQLRYFYEDAPGLHVGRHLGLEKAEADILVYADDDIVAFPTWLEGILEGFADPDVALVGGKNVPLFESDPPPWLSRMWRGNGHGDRVLGPLSVLDLGEKVKEIRPCLVFGCNFSIRKTVLIEAGGFHPDSMPAELIRYRGDGETHVSRCVRRRGYRTLYHPQASVKHLVPAGRMTLDYFCKRGYRQGISDSYTAIRLSHEKPGHLSWNWKRALWPIHRLLWLMVSGRTRRMVRAAKRQGYAYHQEEVSADGELREWVLRENYLGRNGRVPMLQSSGEVGAAKTGNTR